MTFFKFPKFGQRVTRTRRQSEFRRMMRVEGLESRQLMVSDVSVAPLSAVKFEGLDTVTTNYTFLVTRVNDLTSTATVAYNRGADVPGNGIDFNDFVGATTNVFFPIGVTTQTITVQVNGDRDVETDEVFRVTLVSIPGGNANIVSGIATGTILNDDTDWVLSLPTPNLAEGSNGGTTNFPVNITRVGYVGTAMNINYASAASGANPVNAADFTSGLPAGVASFAIGEVTKTINFPVVADRVIEPNETYTVTISGAPSTTDINVAGPLTQTILNDDIDITLSPTTNNVTEGHATNPTLVYTLTRTGNGISQVVNWAVSGFGANPADAADFPGGVLPSGSVSFAPADTTKTFTVTVNADRDVELDETFRVLVTTTDVNTDFINDNTISTIVNDDEDFSIAALSASKDEGSVGATNNYTFTVSRVGLLDAISVGYAVTGSGANPASNLDFAGDVLPSGTLSFAIGEVSKTVTVQVKTDRDVEADEDFVVTLSVSGNADDASGPAAGLIVNDDTDYSFGTANFSQAEGSNNGTTNFLFTVSRVGLLSAASIDYSVTGNGAAPADGLDFIGGVLPTGTVSFALGETSKTVTLSVSGDRDVEANEQFRLTLLNPPALQDITGGTRVVTITNDDSDYTLTPLTSSNAEGASGFTDVVYSLSRSGSMEPASFNYVVVGTGPNPASGADFFGGVLPSGTINFALNSPSQNITVRIAGERVVEADETYQLQLTEVVPNPNADFGQMTADGTIVNDDVDMSIVATDASKNEGNTGTSSFTFTVQRSGVLDARTTDWAVTGSGAVQADATDFVGGVLPSGIINWTVGQTSQVVMISVQGDETPEPDEGFTVTLSNAGTDVDLTPASANGAILNDEATLNLTAIDNVKLEANSGNNPFLFLITRTGNLTRTTTGTWTVVGSGANPASPPGDIVATGTFSFSAGQTERIITINGKGDRIVEADEDFTVSIALTGVNAPFQQILDGTEDGTILNDDIDVAVTTSIASQFEGTGSDVPYLFNVTRTGNPNEAFTVDYAVAGNGATPAANTDFSTPMSGTLSFGVGEMSKTITLMTIADRDVESNEGFKVTLSNAVASTNIDVSAVAATAIINNDDADFTFAVSSATSANRNEGNTGSGNWVFRLSRTGYRPALTGIAYSVTPTGTNPADGADFLVGVFPSGTLNMAANGTSVLLNVAVKGDTLVEFDETFLASVVIPPQYDVSISSAVGTIKNDEKAFGIFPTSASQNENSGGNTFTIQRFGAINTAASVKYSVVGSGANPVDAADFGGSLPTSVTVNFPINASTAVITINPSGDTTTEADEEFSVVLSAPAPTPASWQLVPASATGMVLNDDFEISNIDFAVDGDEDLNEGNASTTSFNFVLTRSGVTTNTTVVDYTVVGSGANPANAADFNGGVFASGSVTFAPGELTKALSILVNGDMSVENDETFTVQLSAPYAGTILNTPSLDRTILNDDVGQFSISAVNPSDTEGNAGQKAYTFTISRPDGSSSYTVNYAATGSGANPADVADFSGSTSGSVLFNDGDLSKTVTILVNGDRDVESDEQFEVTISGGSATYVVPTASATIVSEDMDVALSSSSLVGFEGTLSAGVFSFTVSRSGASTEAFSIDYAIAGNGANPTNAADFSGSLTGTVNFLSGEMSKTVTLSVVNDRDVEVDETFGVTLSNLSSGNADLGTATASGQLTNDDADFTIATTGNSVKNEGNTGSTTFRFLLTRTGYMPALTTIAYTLVPTGANPAASTDFNSAMTGVLSMTSGAATRNVDFAVKGDTTVEAAEEFLVNINPGAEFDITINDALGRILNDD